MMQHAILYLVLGPFSISLIDFLQEKVVDEIQRFNQLEQAVPTVPTSTSNGRYLHPSNGRLYHWPDQY
ncbi:hypothetical protein OUZ56_015864 [Daphnia magna]|uniref:Uncharacterized protein n=1 Tax=Daphnia magna TaxID=35525 RepID=A0ABR0ANZ4_9CRUS|nr:hypothetical protein OUZ56_015864 [Daphnia magna]